MDLFLQTLILYLVIGIGMAAAVYAAPFSENGRWFRILSAVPFWPVYLPILLSPPVVSEKKNTIEKNPSLPRDEMTATIEQVDAELERALNSLDGWAEDVIAREKVRIQELRTAWTIQAERIRDMDRLLSLPEYAETSELMGDAAIISPGAPVHERMLQSRQARRQNMERLRRIRQRAFDDLMGTLAWVRELVSMIHLAKFTGAPASRAEELVAQIAAAVEGLSEVTWQEDSPLHPTNNT